MKKTTTTTTTPKKPLGTELCALWANESAKVGTFYAGTLGDVRILVMPNGFKTAENNQPDLNMYLEPQQPRDGHKAFQVRIAALWAIKGKEGEYVSDQRKRKTFVLRLIEHKTDKHPAARLFAL